MKSVANTIFRTIVPQKNPADVKREYGLPEEVKFMFRLTPEGWFVVTSPDMPGFVTEAKGHDGLVEMVNDAVLSYYDVPRWKADVVYDRLFVGDTVVQYQGQLQTQKA